MEKSRRVACRHAGGCAAVSESEHDRIAEWVQVIGRKPRTAISVDAISLARLVMEYEQALAQRKPEAQPGPDMARYAEYDGVAD